MGAAECGGDLGAHVGEERARVIHGLCTVPHQVAGDEHHVGRADLGCRVLERPAHEQWRRVAAELAVRRGYPERAARIGRV